ncbi:regulator of G-protein signaling 3-like isoform X2 [Festucalex cinctus]
MHTISRLCHLCIRQNLPKVSIVRGQDGFGFTICCDGPVRVQSVDTGGPAHRSGLRQGDAVLQLNGLPVEMWTCGELAHAIRSCPSHIIVVVWRGSPEVRTCCETLPAASKSSKLLQQPAGTKHGRRRRHGGSVVASSLEALGSLLGGRKEEEGKREEEETPCASTLRGTCVTSSTGDNYIILSPLTPQEQLLQSRFEETSRTMGRVYQTHPRRGLNLPADSSGQALIQPCSAFSSTLRNYANYANYQNCAIIQSHRPSGDFGQAAKTLIFPIFVEPVDLCGPGRTLLMCEEMLLQRDRQPPCKVSVSIYDDVVLLSREDGTGRAHVLTSPLYLRTLRLQEAASAPHRLFLLQTCGSGWRCLFTLEAFSLEQKLRVGLCLRDNIQRQLLAEETGRRRQLTASPHTSLPTSGYASTPRLPSPVWKERGEVEEEEEEEGSGLHLEELSSASRLEGIRRCVSERSLPASTSGFRRSYSLSDSAVHRLTFDLQASCLPSTQTLRKHLTSEGVMLKHTLELLRGAKDVEIGKDLRKKTKSFASDVRLRLPFLRRRKRSVQSESLERALRNARPSAREVLMWSESLQALLANRYGLAVFRHFLRSEYSEENLDFWLAVETFKQTRPLGKTADKIYEDFEEVSVDSKVRELMQRSLRLGAGTDSLQLAQDRIFELMEADSYPRFLRSRLYAQLANQDAGPADHSRATSAEAFDRNPTGKVVIV